jgi:CRISPR/Cas system CSM-associated protein Csm3 (group 7 of RAMP superfamily)
MTKLKMTFDIQSYWHVGSGEEGGAYADNLCLKNHLGLPYLPGRAIKGLLRSAFELAEQNSWFVSKKGETTYLSKFVFGQEGESLSDQGCLVIDSAELSKGEQAYFEQNPSHTIQLFDVHFSTAIDGETGSAKKGSLRSLEVALPMQLISEIEVNATFGDYNKDEIAGFLRQVAPLISQLGAKRHRGYGDVLVSVE